MKRYIIIVSLTLATLGAARAQAQPPVPAPARDSVARAAQAEHSKLLERETTMRRSLDSLQGMLNTRRSSYDAHPEWADSLSRDIIKLESDIFEMRSKLSRLGAQISAAEATIAKSSAPAAPRRAARSLYTSQYFRENVSTKDLSLFATTPTVITSVAGLKMEIDNLYSRLGQLKAEHEAANKQEELDQIITEASKVKAQIATLDAKVEATWGNLYNRRMDNYLVLTDRLGGASRNQMEALDLLSREIVGAENAQSVAPTLTAYVPQNKLLLNYELILAEKLNLSAVADSLKTLAAAPVTDLPYPDIAFPYRSLTLYGGVSFNSPHSYTDVATIPALHIPSKGAYYAIQLALSSAPASSLKIFKGGEPLQQEKTPSGYYRYTVGGFRTYADAYAAYRQCLTAGFKAPTIVAWLNGAYTAATKVKAWQAANPDADASGHNITITTSRSDIAATLKSTIDINAPGKTITRMPNADGTFTFTIATFQASDEARVIAEILKTKLPGIEPKVTSAGESSDQEE